MSQYVHFQRFGAEIYFALFVLAAIFRKKIESAVGALMELAQARYPRTAHLISRLLPPSRRYVVYEAGRIVPIRETGSGLPAGFDVDDEQEDDQPTEVNPDNWESKQLEGWQHWVNVW